MTDHVALITSINNTGNGVSSKVFAYIVPAGVNRLLTVSVSVRASGSVSSITFGAQALTKLAEKNYAAGNNPRVELWYLVAPIETTANITVTMSGVEYFGLCAASYVNVNQAAPFESNNVQSGTSGTAMVSTLTYTHFYNLSMDVICCEGTITSASDQTLVWANNVTGSWRGAGSIKPQDIIDVRTHWTVSSNWAAIIADIKSSFVPAVPSVRSIYTAPSSDAPIFDRTWTDITNKTQKAYFNYYDWARIYRNSILINTSAVSFTGSAITFDTIATPTQITIPTITNLNKLIGNIERVRLAMSPYISGMPALKTTWLEGNVESPTYKDVNLWEKTISDILNYFTKRHLRSGLLISGAGMTRNNKWRH